LLDAALRRAEGLRREIGTIAGLHVEGRSGFCGEGKPFDLDPLQVVVDVERLGISGTVQRTGWQTSAESACTWPITGALPRS
jgi:hypothetical protein